MVFGSTAVSRLQVTTAVYTAGTGSTPVVGVYTRLQSIDAVLAPCALHHVYDTKCQVA